MATQHFKRNLLLNLYREEKISLVCFPLPLERDKNVSHLQPLSSIWRPLAFLPVTLSVLVDPPLPSNTYNTHREQPHTYPTTDCGLHPVSGSQLPEPLKCPDWNGAKKVAFGLLTFGCRQSSREGDFWLPPKGGGWLPGKPKLIKTNQNCD